MSNTTLMGGKRKSSAISLNNDTTLAPKKKRLNGTLAKMRAGTISRMILKNFMCHSLLDVDLSNNVNVLIGRNGSGKSAILTALVVGLGGKASLTNRGNSIKSFIKAGKPSGSIEIEICNSGAMAYRPKIYGNQITVQRNITASGSTSYKIKAANGDVITTKSKELNNILTGLNIQIDNPISILNQDTSRNFLSSNDPKHKFTLFMRATRLETLEQEQKQMLVNEHDFGRIYKDKLQDYQLLQSEYKKLQQKAENHRSISSLREKLTLAAVELLWAKVRDAEDELKQLQKNLNHLTSRKEQLHEKCSNRSEKVQIIKDEILSLEQKIVKLKETASVQLRPQIDVKHTIDDLTAKYNAKRREKQLIRSKLESKSNDVTTLEREIANASENMNRAEQEKLKRLAAIQEKRAKISEVEEHIQTTKNDLYQYTQDFTRDSRKQNLQHELASIERRIENDRSTLRSLQNDSSNTLCVYGRDMPRIKQMIEQNKHRFKHEPKGPLGAYIKLKDKRWAVAIEGFIGVGLLGAFVVDNQSDSKQLMQIFQNVLGPSGRKPMIITTKFIFNKHNVCQNLVQAPKGCISLYAAVEIADAVVSNCIVDQKAIEGILLLPNDELATRLMSNRDNVPRNCCQGVTSKGDVYYPDPNYKTYGSRYHRAQYLQVDTKEHIIELQKSIEGLAEKKTSLQRQIAEISREINDQNASKSALERKLSQLAASKSQYKRQLDELNASADPEVANIELLETELREIRAEIEAKNVEFARVCTEIKEIRALLGEREEKLKQLKTANSSIADRISELESQMNEHQIRQREISTSDEFDKRKVRELELKEAEAKENVQRKQAVVDTYTEQASNMGERCPEIRRIPVIHDELKSLESALRRIESDTENSEEVLKKIGILNSKMDAVEELLRSNRTNMGELSKALARRQRQYTITENYYITYMKHSFKTIMELRQFQGSIEINTQSKSLELNVIPQHGTQGLTTTSNLSGGERSFSTVAFLYSLWQCMDFPFYFLDEFDVYMDKMNRTKVFDVLLHHAQYHPELQFVFLTPQDVSFIKNNVSILKLADPERNPV